MHVRLLYKRGSVAVVHGVAVVIGYQLRGGGTASWGGFRRRILCVELWSVRALVCGSWCAHLRDRRVSSFYLFDKLVFCFHDLILHIQLI